jgi:molecular chaperone DnaK (HSP70)
MTEHRKKLVIGIDYGTTNSGVAYAVVTDPKDDNVPIEVLREWPHGKLADNIPSDIAYNENGEPIAYASDCSPELRPLQWVKLLLEPAGLGEKRPGTERIWHSMETLDKLGKHPIDVVADYLRWLWSEVEKSLEESGDDIDADETVVVITLPASWSDRAKNTMLQAAQRAGIDNGRTLKFRAEPEAAAMWELKTRAKKRQVAVGDCFIVCDAGGGTVDVVSFQVLSLEPLSLNQVVVSEGDFCGSMFINAQFETQLRVFLQSDFNKLGTETKARIRDEFEDTIKRKYSPEASTEYTIPVNGLKDNDKKGIKDGKLKVSKAVLER